MLITALSITLLVLACISYRKEPTLSKRSAIKVVTIINSIVVALYILYIALMISVRFFVSSSGLLNSILPENIYEIITSVSNATFTVFIFRMIIPCLTGVVSTVIGYCTYLSDRLTNQAKTNQHNEEMLQKTAHKFCKRCGTCAPYYANICKHCQGTDFDYNAPEVSQASYGMIPQQLEDSTTNITKDNNQL